MTPLFFVCCTLQNKVINIYSFSSLSHTIQFISLFVCLFLSFSYSVFVLDLFIMFDDGLLSQLSSSTIFCISVELSPSLVRLSKWLDPILS